MSSIRRLPFLLTMTLALWNPAFGQEAPVNKKSVTIVKKSWGKGEVAAVTRSLKWTVKQTVHMKKKKTGPPSVRRQTGVFFDDRRIEILELQSGELRKLKVTFVKKTQTLDLGPKYGAVKETEDSFQGRTIVVERQGREYRVTQDKKPLESLELLKARRLTVPTFLVQNNGLASSIPAKTFKVGEALSIPSDHLIGVLDLHDRALQFSVCALNYVGMKTVEGQACALFSLEFKAATKKGAPMRTLVSGSGTLLVEVATGRQRSLSIKGRVSRESKAGAAVLLKSEGELTVEERMKNAKKGREK